MQSMSCATTFAPNLPASLASWPCGFAQRRPQIPYVLRLVGRDRLGWTYPPISLSDGQSRAVFALPGVTTLRAWRHEVQSLYDELDLVVKHNDRLKPWCPRKVKDLLWPTLESLP